MTKVLLAANVKAGVTMAEQEYSLPDISEEQVEKAALPVGKRADQEASDETKYIDLEENKDELKSIEEDTIQENFETSEKAVIASS